MNTDIQSTKETSDLFQAVNKLNPTEADKKRLKECFEADPALCQDISNLSGAIENMIIKKFSQSYLTQESYRLKLAAMRDNLGWNTASEVEKILIEQVCLNWLRHNFMEMIHFEKTQESHSVETGLYWDKILTGAQRRYLQACESLAKVRKLLTEAELKEQQAKNKRSKSTLIAQQILKNATI